MTRFRPCIDLHAGQVKQIVGGTLRDDDHDSKNQSSQTSSQQQLRTNHISPHSAGHFAQLYRAHVLNGAHVIMLGGGNEAAAKEALSAWPGGLQLGGGLTAENAGMWMEWGAEKVIVTSYLFPDARFSLQRLKAVLAALGHDKSKLVIDLSCRRQRRQRDGRSWDTDEWEWVVAMNKWQRLTDMVVNEETIRMLEPYCSEFLIHAADNEGLQRGIDEELVRRLGEWCSIPVTYAGGARSLQDLDLVKELSRGRVDLTIGSALDIFGGETVSFEDCIAWNNAQNTHDIGAA